MLIGQVFTSLPVGIDVEKIIGHEIGRIATIASLVSTHHVRTPSLKCPAAKPGT